MTAEEREKLHDLFSEALETIGKAASQPSMPAWTEAYRAKNTFLQALYAVEVTP